MRHALFLALAYMRFHRGKSLALIVSIALIAAVPAATRIVLQASERALNQRAETSPLVLGARGSALDLTLAALYFTNAPPATIPFAASEAVWDSGLATAIPLSVGFSAKGLPVVGTTLDYFDYRGLAVASGRPLGLIGETLLGADAATRLALQPGDTLITDAGTLFDLAGSYPLELTVAGVLQPNGTADDGAVFVDLKTAWIIAGIGHGHEAIKADPNAPGDLPVVASPAIRQFTRITPDNIESFHLHAGSETLPLSAVLVVPNDAKSGAILQGRYLEAGNPYHLIVPAEVIKGLLSTLFRIGRILDAVVLVVGAAALIAIALALTLATQLRAPEMQTLFRLGAHRATIARALAAQIGLILLGGAVLAATLLLPLTYYSSIIAAALVAAAP